MGVSRFNSEGYYDPTPYEAVSNIEKERVKWRPVVYICSPYAGDPEANTEKARRYCRFAVEKDAVPLAPHLFLPQFLKEETERDLALFMDLVYLGKCAEMWVFGEKITDGMRVEIDRAKKKNMRIRYFSDSCAEAET